MYNDNYKFITATLMQCSDPQSFIAEALSSTNCKFRCLDVTTEKCLKLCFESMSFFHKQPYACARTLRIKAYAFVKTISTHSQN